MNRPEPLPTLWFGPPPTLRTDERWVAHHPANRSQGKRAVGGGLHFTNCRVLFTPNVIDAWMGAESWSCALDDIASVGVEPARFALSELFSGGLRTRLRIDLRDRRFDFFVVADPAGKAAALQRLLPAPR